MLAFLDSLDASGWLIGLLSNAEPCADPIGGATLAPRGGGLSAPSPLSLSGTLPLAGDEGPATAESAEPAADDEPCELDDDEERLLVELQALALQQRTLADQEDDAARELEGVDAKVARQEELLGELRRTLEGYHALREQHNTVVERVAALQSERDRLFGELERQASAQHASSAAGGASESRKRLQDKIKSLDDELKGARSQKSRLEKQRNAAERELKRCKELEEQLTELRKSRATLQKKSTEAAKRARSGELVLQRQVTSLRKLSGEAQRAKARAQEGQRSVERMLDKQVRENRALKEKNKAQHEHITAMLALSRHGQRRRFRQPTAASASRVGSRFASTSASGGGSAASKLRARSQSVQPTAAQPAGAATLGAPPKGRLQSSYDDASLAHHGAPKGEAAAAAKADATAAGELAAYADEASQRMRTVRFQGEQLLEAAVASRRLEDEYFARQSEHRVLSEDLRTKLRELKEAKAALKAASEAAAHGATARRASMARLSSAHVSSGKPDADDARRRAAGRRVERGRRRGARARGGHRRLSASLALTDRELETLRSKLVSDASLADDGADAAGGEGGGGGRHGRRRGREREREGVRFLEALNASELRSYSLWLMETLLQGDVPRARRRRRARAPEAARGARRRDRRRAARALRARRGRVRRRLSMAAVECARGADESERGEARSAETDAELSAARARAAELEAELSNARDAAAVHAAAARASGSDDEAVSAGLAELQLLQAELGGRVSDVGLVENAVALALDRARSRSARPARGDRAAHRAAPRAARAHARRARGGARGAGRRAGGAAAAPARRARGSAERRARPLVRGARPHECDVRRGRDARGGPRGVRRERRGGARRHRSRHARAPAARRAERRAGAVGGGDARRAGRRRRGARRRRRRRQRAALRDHPRGVRAGPQEHALRAARARAQACDLRERAAIVCRELFGGAPQSAPALARLCRSAAERESLASQGDLEQALAKAARLVVDDGAPAPSTSMLPSVRRATKRAGDPLRHRFYARAPAPELFSSDARARLAQLRTIAGVLERMASDRGAIVDELARAIAELVEKGEICSERVEGAPRDLSEPKLRALNAAVHALAAESEASVATARASLEQIWEAMPAAAASDETRRRALEAAASAAKAAAARKIDLGALSAPNAARELWLCDVAGLAGKAAAHALARRAAHGAFFAAFRDAEARKGAFGAIVAADCAYGERHDKITAFEARVADPNRLKSRDRRHAKSALEEESERSKFKKDRGGGRAVNEGAARVARDVRRHAVQRARGVCDAAHGACRPAANHEPLVKPLDRADAPRHEAGPRARQRRVGQLAAERRRRPSSSAPPSPPPPPPRQSTSPPGSVGSGASADEPGVLKGDPFALTRQTLKRHTRAQAAGEENRAPPAPRGRA